MNAGTRTVRIAGAAGAIDVALDRPAGAPTGLALIAHPHPLYGGTRDNKVVQTLARAFLALGYACYRPDFRGVGLSEGAYDEGRGETDDLVAVARAARAAAAADGQADLPLVLAGFSFGAFVQAQVAQRLAQAGEPAARLVLVAPAVSRFALGEVAPDTLVIHGETDDVVPLPAVLDWARPMTLPVVVLPATDHFFHRRLPLLKRLVLGAFGAHASEFSDPAADADPG
jgi:alpha/beta superfamily hydrolase